MPHPRASKIGRIALLLAPLLLGGSIASGSEPAPATPPGALDLLRSTAAEHGLPSLSAAAARDGEVVFAAAVGMEDLERGVEASPQTVYPLGSVTKTVTATAALRLAEQGALDLDAPVRQYCPAYPEKPHEITVRQLLAHLGGVRHYDYRRFEEDFLNTKRFSSIEEALTKFAGDPLAVEPGTEHLYSSWGYVLVGCALEGAGGRTYPELVRAHVLGPAGMERTSLATPSDIVPHRAAGYSKADDGSWRNAGCFDASDRHPAGGLLGTPTDLVRLGTALLDGRLLEDGSLDAMWSVQRTSGGEPTGAGLGWALSEDGAEAFHGGTTVGGTAYLYVRPADRLVVAFATNVSLWTEGRHELARALAELAASGGAPASGGAGD